MKLIFALTASAILFAPGLHGQSAATSDQQLAALVREVQTQQAQMAENQTKIEEKLAVIAEAVRVAKIYASRGGH